MNSSSQDRELADPERWAAVVTCWCDGVYGHRWIVYPEQPEQYVRQVAEDLSEWTLLLVEHYAEAVNLAELDLLHESFGSGPYLEDEWDWMTVCDLLKRLPDIAVAKYRENNSPAVGDSFWYSQLIGFLNDTFPDNDGVWLNFEGPLSEFLPTLLDFEAKGFKEVGDLSDSRASWLGRLAVLSRLSWHPSVPQERLRAFNRLVTEFNDHYSESFSLD